MKPTLGRVVHFRDRSDWRSAMVVREEPLVLRVLCDVAGYVSERDYNTLATEGTEIGCWRWPPRVEPIPAPAAVVHGPSYDRGFEDARRMAIAIADDQRRLATEEMDRHGGLSGETGELTMRDLHEQAMNQAASIARLIGEMKP